METTEKKATGLIENWNLFVKKAETYFRALNGLLSKLGIPDGTVTVHTFASSTARGEIRFFDSAGCAETVHDSIGTTEQAEAEEQLAGIIKADKEQTHFSFSAQTAFQNAYDEFGMTTGNEEIGIYGAAVQCVRTEAPKKLLSELLAQICVFTKGVMDDPSFGFEENMLDNTVFTALRKQIDIDFYNTLAASAYEKRVASGGLLLVDGDTPYDLKISFDEKYPLELGNVRQIRKLLETSGDELYLVCKKGNVIGLGDCSGDCVRVQFNGHQRWSYFDKGRELLSYKEGTYTFVLDEEKNFIQSFPKNFIPRQNVRQLNNILNEIIRRQKHGTLLIVSDEAEAEAARLCKLKRGYAIKPVDLKLPEVRKLLASITLIDGAIFVDTNFVCYGIGVILDGIAVNPGSSSRGARYNSALCYIENKDYEKYVAVIVSDDETVDIIYNPAEK